MWKYVCCLLVAAITPTFGQTLKLNIGSLDFGPSELAYGDCIQVPITFTNTGSEPLILESYVFTLKISDWDDMLFGGEEGNYLVANAFISDPGLAITNPASAITNLLSGTPVPSCPTIFNQATQGGISLDWTSGMANTVFVQNNAEAMNWKRATVFNSAPPFSLAQIEAGETYLAGILVLELGLVSPASLLEIEATSQLEDPTGNAYVISAVPFGPIGDGTEEFFDISEAYNQVNVAIAIPDPIFKAFLLSLYDTDMNGEIRISEALGVTDPMICNDLAIEDLTGIEAFSNLVGLDVGNNDLTELPQNLTVLSGLNYLDIRNNLLDICDCPDIVSIWTVIRQNGGQLELDPSSCPVGANLVGWPFSISVLDLIPQCAEW